MKYKFDDLLEYVKNKAKDNIDWTKAYADYVPKYIEAAKKGGEWPKDLLDNLLSNDRNNPVASLRLPQGKFNKEDISEIKKNWSEIAPLLQQIAENQKDPQFDVYRKLEDKIFELCTEREKNPRRTRPRAAVHRMIAALQPQLLTTIVNEASLIEVCDLLAKHTDIGIEFEGDYYDKSHALQKLILEKSKQSGMEVPAYAWGLYLQINRLETVEEYVNLLNNNKNLILTGAPGTGKTYLAKRIAEKLEATKENGRLGFVQFHPSYDYTDFVEGLRPISENGIIGFERKDGIFMEFCRKALNDPDPDNNYVFIIDEINRGDMSKILGELFFSIDPGYRGKEGRVSTQYKNLWNKDFDGSYEFYIPKNVFIIGTMNDIDRSVESMDFAMRRRFAFKEVTPDSRTVMIDEKFTQDSDEIKNRMTNLNIAIKNKSMLDSGYQIGPAYFLKLESYLNSDTMWDQLWDNHLKGLLFEYLRGEPKAEREQLLKEFRDAYDKA